MKVIDARTGQEVAIGQTVTYDDGERATLLQVEPGFLRARARFSVVRRGRLCGCEWLPLQVRWTHPAFFLQHVAFIPS